MPVKGSPYSGLAWPSGRMLALAFKKVYLENVSPEASEENCERKRIYLRPTRAAHEEE